MNKPSAEFNHKPTENKISEIEKDTIGYGKSFIDGNQALGNPPERLISKVIFFIENSGSMMGYVTGSTNYVNILTDIANHPEFIKEGIERLFYCGSGTSETQKIADLSINLVPARFNQRKSNLNNMFKAALDSTEKNNISILISDGIYDMCPNPEPLNELERLGHELRSIFIKRLSNSDFQTIVVKLNSNFNGMYFSGNCCGSHRINQSRPFYLWIMGGSESLKEYFPDEYLKNLRGYNNSARFFKYNIDKDVYMPISHKRIGTYYPSNRDKFSIEKVKSNAGIFQFSIAVDYSLLPLNDKYLEDTTNYNCTNGFSVVSVDQPNAVTKLGFPNQTHLIVVKKTGNPIGELTVSLLNKGYEWISSTSTTTIVTF
jgi:hypothetical protein